MAAGGELEASNFSGGITIKGDGVEVEVSFFFRCRETACSPRVPFLHLLRLLLRSFLHQSIVLCVLLRKH